MGVLTREGFEQLDRYKYVSGTYSPLDNILNHWWNFAITLVPMNIAPNVLTFSGLLCLLISFILVIVHAPNLTEPAPSWVYFTVAILHIIYQTLDAIDGKQARRTKSGSALGQLFDHGCDSVGLSFSLLCLAGSVR